MMRQGRIAIAVQVAETLQGTVMRSLRVHAAGAVDELQLVRIQIQIVCNTQGNLGRLGRIQQLTLGTHRDELARGHRQRTGQQARNTRE